MAEIRLDKLGKRFPNGFWAVKDLSLEIPNAPQVFTEQVQPQLEVQINTTAGKFSDPYYEVTVTATVTAKTGEKTLFLAEAVQAGIFQLRNVPAEELGPLLVSACGISAGHRVLDVAAGTGNVAIRAAQAGASVVASDLTPENFDAGRRAAQEAGVELEWVPARRSP